MKDSSPEQLFKDFQLQTALSYGLTPQSYNEQTHTMQLANGDILDLSSDYDLVLRYGPNFMPRAATTLHFYLVDRTTLPDAYQGFSHDHQQEARSALAWLIIHPKSPQNQIKLARLEKLYNLADWNKQFQLAAHYQEAFMEKWYKSHSFNQSQYDHLLTLQLANCHRLGGDIIQAHKITEPVVAYFDDLAANRNKANQLKLNDLHGTYFNALLLLGKWDDCASITTLITKKIHGRWRSAHAAVSAYVARDQTEYEASMKRLGKLAKQEQTDAGQAVTWTDMFELIPPL